jgi:DNA polymerase I
LGIKVVIDIETNSAINPTKIWLVVCKDLDTGEYYRFRELHDGNQPSEEARRFLEFAKTVTYWVGHSWLEFDYPVLNRLVGLVVPDVFSTDVSLDTLILSRLVDYSRGRVQIPGDDHPITRGHSIESYGDEFKIPKLDFSDFTRYSSELEVYCDRDVEICHRIYLKYLSIISDPTWAPSIALEHSFQSVVNSLHNNGFAFNVVRATGLLDKVTKELGELDGKIASAFPPTQSVVRYFTPKGTKFGTISKTSVPRSLWDRISDYEVGKVYPLFATKEFNPASHKQLIEILHTAGWRPADKTQTHIDLEREVNKLKRSHNKDPELDLRLKLCEDKLINNMAKYGFRINENNLETLPPDAPPSARLLARRILLESRRRTLTEWLGLVSVDGRIHGRYYGIGAWTHRMSHQSPNTANIPNEYDTSGKKKLLGKEMRSCWCAPRGRLLVGVDAEGIQLRVFAHLIDDKEFTDALVKGRKEDKTDPHSLNQRILGSVCKTRAAAKRFIYALLLGAGLWKLSQILECTEAECREALDSLLRRYAGWQRLRDEEIPRDAKRGHFVGLDGRKVPIPGTTVGERKHLAMSGYLQNGEKIVMAKATVKFLPNLPEKCFLVNLVHDEWQTEVPNNMETALQVARLQADALRLVGEELKLKCPLAGSFYNDDTKDFTIATNWSSTH